MSSIPRIFVSPSSLNWPECRLDDFSFHHLRDVLRLRPGQAVEVVSQGGLWLASVIEFQPKRKSLMATPTSSVAIAPSQLNIHLIQAVPKVDKISEIIRSCTEMGVGRISPVVSERCVSVPTEKATAKLDRWRQVAYSAAAQSRQPRLPRIDPLDELESSLRSIPNHATKIVFWEESSIGLQTIVGRMPASADPRDVVVVIGPEGGFSEREIQMMAQYGFDEASLGPTILRVEHAGLVAIAQLTYALWR